MITRFKTEQELVEAFESLTGLKMVCEPKFFSDSLKSYRLLSPTGVKLMTLTLLHTPIEGSWNIGGIGYDPEFKPLW